MPIPAFEADGYLPEGVHLVTEEELTARFGQATPVRQRLMERVADMIVSDQQLGVAASQLADLKEWRDRLLHSTDRSAFDVHTVVSGIERMMARLQRQIDAYRSAKAGQLPAVLVARVQNESLGEVAEALMRLRVANGMSVEDAARVVGRSPSSIGPWEDEAYKNYTLRELATLVATLGRELQISFVVPDAGDPSGDACEAEPGSEALLDVSERCSKPLEPGDREVEALRGSPAFQQFLEERSRSTRRIALEEVEAGIERDLERQKPTI